MGKKLDDGNRVTKKTKNKEKMKRFGTKTSKHIRISQQFRATPDFGIQPKKK